ncbi:hypothetical protein [Bathymodiolus platifrons methanotrophic gill symbiont]|uniref:hypothetical protein n=1 Tax=Bathymodiolus platifrons methanotrophic gill symbiont TaxID=113268 RepID=UPI001C8EFA99|nr:hypothetical protein [Bathymodiolus platifrons methanotrophic gill symbiont]
MPFILSPPTLALRFRQNNGPTPSGDYQPSRSLSMAGSACDNLGAPCYLTKFRDSCRRNSFTYAANRRCSSRPASATD